MIKDIVEYFYPNFFKKDRETETRIGLFFGSTNSNLMEHLFYERRFDSIYYYVDNEITDDLVYNKIKSQVDNLIHRDTLFLYFGSGVPISKDIINIFRVLRKRLYIFIVIENYDYNFFPIPYIIHYPNEKIRIRNDEMYVPLIVSIYGKKKYILNILEETLLKHRKINIRILLIYLQDNFFDLKKIYNELPEICISSFDCYNFNF
jgi:hypothetical protein